MRKSHENKGDTNLMKNLITVNWRRKKTGSDGYRAGEEEEQSSTMKASYWLDSCRI